ncbi:MAG: hypothetical protein ACTSQM_05225, partial [Candidatus Odinarchaeia archaeon]
MSTYRSQSINIALTALFAAIQTAAAIIPFTIPLGLSGVISMGVIVAPLSGIILGPILGGTATLIGSILGGFINPASWVLGPFTIIPPTIASVACGLIKIGKGYLSGVAIWGAIIAYYLSPIGQLAWSYPWLHIISGIVAVSPITKIAYDAFENPYDRNQLFTILGVVIFSIIGGVAGFVSIQ